MAPSRAEVETQWKNSVKLLHEARLFGSVNAQNWVTLQDTLDQSVESDYAAAILSSVARSRSYLAALLSNDNAANQLLPHLRSYCRHIANTPEASDAQSMADRLIQYMRDNAFTVNAREFTFGSPAAGGGIVGTGAILRLNVDDYGFSIESQHADAKTAKCKFDQASGTAKHEEIFEFRGQSPGQDGLQLSGSGKMKYIASLSARQSLLSNPSFSQIGGTYAAPTSLTGWTSSITVDSTGYTLDPVNYYRDFKGDSIPYALNIKLTASLHQHLSLLSTSLRSDVPYMLQVAWNRQVGAATGTLVARMGAVNNNVVVAAQAGWQLLRVPVAFGSNNWYRAFKENDLDISLEWTRTAGELLIDDVLLVPATSFDGSWYWVLGGATPFSYDDYFTWTDTEVGSILQYWFWRAYGRYLPAVTGAAETWTDP